MAAGTFTQEVCALFDSNIKAVYTINQIAKELGKPYAFTHRKVKELVDDGLLKIISIGRSHLCSINLGDPRASVHLMRREIEKLMSKGEPLQKTSSALTRLKATVTIHTAAFDGNDVLYVVLDDMSQAPRVQSSLANYAKTVECISKEQFQQLLLDDVGKLYSQHVVVTGFERFFELVHEISADLDQVYNPLLKGRGWS